MLESGEMARDVVRKLLVSFDLLEESIAAARRVVDETAPGHPSLLQRIANYEEILQKQRKLTGQLCSHIAMGNWEEVGRHVKLINGLSAMVYSDAKELAGILFGRREAASYESCEKAAN